MRTKRIPGEVFMKKEFAGFISNKLIVRIPTLDTFLKHGFNYKSEKEDYGHCMICGDPNCIEFANVEVLNENREHSGWCCHVSECQLEDIQ